MIFYDPCASSTPVRRKRNDAKKCQIKDPCAFEDSRQFTSCRQIVWCLSSSDAGIQSTPRSINQPQMLLGRAVDLVDPVFVVTCCDMSCGSQPERGSEFNSQSILSTHSGVSTTPGYKKETRSDVVILPHACRGNVRKSGAF